MPGKSGHLPKLHNRYMEETNCEPSPLVLRSHKTVCCLMTATSDEREDCRLRQGSPTLGEIQSGGLTALDEIPQALPTLLRFKGPVHSRGPLFLCRGPGVPSSSRLCPAFDEWRHSEWGLHHLPPWRGRPEAAGVLRHDHGRGWLDRKYTRGSPGTRTSGSSPPGTAPVDPASPSSARPLSTPHVPRGAPHCPQSHFSAARHGFGGAERGTACWGCSGLPREGVASAVTVHVGPPGQGPMAQRGRGLVCWELQL